MTLNLVALVRGVEKKRPGAREKRIKRKEVTNYAGRQVL